jgi:hypothetical protein
MTLRRSAVLRLGFEETSLRIPLDAISPIRNVTDAVRASIKYKQIAASIAEVGIIEPPVVIRDAHDPESFHLLDGHLRIDIERGRGQKEAVCLIATDDEAFTYNRRISRMATIQEHKMILNAIKKGASEDRLARALNVDISNIRLKRNLLVGICPEVAELLKDRHVPLNVFRYLRAFRPLPQIDAARTMVAMNRFSITYMKSLVAAAAADDLVPGYRKQPKGLSPEQIDVMRGEAEQVNHQFKLIEKSYSADNLDLVLAIGYVSKLLGNALVVRHMAQHHSEILAEFQKLAELQKAA